MEEMRRPGHVAWLRSLTPEQGYQILLDLHRFADACPMTAEERERLDRWRWERKLEERLRIVAALQALDRLREQDGK